MSLNLVQTVADYLKSQPETKLTARQIAVWIYENFPNECKEKQERSTAKVVPINTEDAFIQQLVAEIGASRPRLQTKSPHIKTTEGRPRKYYYSEKSDEAELSQAENQEGLSNISPLATKLSEHDLYPMLAEYLWTEFGEKIYTKRIDEKRSINSRGLNGNKWLYPDLVSLEDLSSEWSQSIKDCAAVCFDKKSTIWSFEVKLLVNRSNVREVYFQSVSNSSWANFGYLVAAEIEGADTMKELRMLSALHGIGVMRLDVDNISESQIVIPAKERDILDWDTANRLLVENKDFAEFIKLLKEFYQTGNPRKSEWDIP